MLYYARKVKQAIELADIPADVVTDVLGGFDKIVFLRPQFAAGHRNNAYVDPEESVQQIASDLTATYKKHCDVYYG